MPDLSTCRDVGSCRPLALPPTKHHVVAAQRASGMLRVEPHTGTLPMADKQHTRQFNAAARAPKSTRIVSDRPTSRCLSKCHCWCELNDD
eukprot:5869544-Pyramimonas_sp.AAC.1